jgi:membrane-bound acyltransferase YfiQ involved in biofilm formation
MNFRKKCKLLCVASALMFVFGIVRGIGGIVNLLNDEHSLAFFSSSATLLVLLVVGFILLSAATFIIAIAIFEHNKKYLSAGIILTLLFVFNGVVQGYFSTGKPLDQGTIENIFAAVLIISLLMLGKRNLDKTEKA